MKEKRFTFGKSIIVLDFVLFIGTLLISFYFVVKGYDPTFSAAAIGIVGTILASSIIFYFRKAQEENIIKTRILFMERSAKVQTKTFEDMIKIKQKYDVTDEDIQYIKDNTFIDEMANNAITSTDAKFDELEADAETPVDIQTL